MDESLENLIEQRSDTAEACNARQQQETKQLLNRFYQAFNSQEWERLLSMVSSDVVLDLGAGERVWGKEALTEHIYRTQLQHREHVFDITIMTDSSGLRAAAEYTVLGIPLEDRPETSGPIGTMAQSYRISMGVFFAIDGNHISRISQYSDLPATPTLGI